MSVSFLYFWCKSDRVNLLSVEGVCKVVGGQLILKETSFSQQQFQKIAIAGATGSGKSTLVKIAAGLMTPDAGSVIFDHERVKRMPEEKLIPGHKGIAYLSQEFELRNHHRMEELLTYANNLTDEAAARIYEICDISHLLKRNTWQLSGGEKQRIALARLLVSSPKLLILDEPYTNLDMIHKNILKNAIRELGEQLGISCIQISHDPLDTLPWADEIIVMRDGEIIQKASPEQIYRQPVDEYVAGLFGSYNLIDNTVNPFFNIRSNGKKLLIRPEQLRINRDNSGAPGRVVGVAFSGSYYEVRVELGGREILVREMGHCAVRKDDVVRVSVDEEDVWFMEH